jgi:negative regulator of flagellin synthesis FlgM
MSSIGSGPGLGSGANIEVAAALQVGATDPRQTTTLDANTSLAQGTQSTSTTTTTTGSTAAPAVVTDTTSAAGAIPQDSDRVAAIKKAIEQGQYPIVPTKIGDAMIAASMLWRSPK